MSCKELLRDKPIALPDQNHLDYCCSICGDIHHLSSQKSAIRDLTPRVVNEVSTRSFY